MRNTMKKAFSLMMIALLVITTMPAMTFAVPGFSISVNAATITSNSAVVTLNNTAPGATYTAALTGGPGTFDPATKKLTGLSANKDYSVTVTEKSFASTKTRFDVKREGGNNNRKYYYMDNNTKIYINNNAVYHRHWSISGYYYHDGFDKDNNSFTDAYASVSKSATATFKTKVTPKLTLVVGTGGVAKIKGTVYPTGTYTLPTTLLPETFTGKSYSNAGYAGGSTLSYHFDATGLATWNVNFASHSSVYGMPYYDHNGFFSGKNALGVDISDYIPMDDVLSARFDANPSQSSYALGEVAVITLSVLDIDGDANTHKLNQVDIFLKNDGSNDLLGSPDVIEDSKTLTYSFDIPDSEDELAGFTKGPDVNGKSIYTKVVTFDLVDRYSGDKGAAIIKTSTCIITVEVDIPLPEFKVTFDTMGGSPQPDSQDIPSGGTVSEPADPFKDGHTFDYWTLNGDEYDFSDEVTGPLNLVAQYTEIPASSETSSEEESSEEESSEEESSEEESSEEESSEEQSSEEQSSEEQSSEEQSSEEQSSETPTQVVQPTTADDDDEDEDDVIFFATIVATTEAATEELTNEETPLGAVEVINFDAMVEDLPLDTTEEVVIIEIDEPTPLADALPQTGQLPVELYYGIGGLISAAGVFLKRKK